LRYSNRENGILSQQIIDGGEGLHINWASYYVEILDLKKDIPIGYGRLGRVVVTDLFNYHMPLVRYDTGDLAIMDIDKNSFNGAPSFFKVEGRRMDTIYDTQGKVVTSTIVYELECFSEFKQFQVIQEDHKTYRIRINVDGVFKQESKITRMLNGFLGKDANIVIDYVDEIPQLSSGKRKVTLNKYKP
jgi:phenylacetate-CoA ligase